MDPNWLVGGGGGQAPSQQAPPAATQPQRQRPSLTAITMTGLDTQGRESFTFTFADGLKAVETLPELIQMGFDPKIASAVDEVFTHIGDLVYSTNRGGGGIGR